ncbi:hypothetical protein AVEN_60607-1 [Araneus ventricosus]|uniref:Uncharacterized protein n=1 Tax=Araneus ventricosus TaxID=182803 RepID=A0A4Y2AAI7_ARAVE|nr:hypothetical protein AVEN_60607-1 [Araneus ventricosus]
MASLSGPSSHRAPSTLTPGIACLRSVTDPPIESEIRSLLSSPSNDFFSGVPSKGSSQYLDVLLESNIGTRVSQEC